MSYTHTSAGANSNVKVSLQKDGDTRNLVLQTQVDKPRGGSLTQTKVIDLKSKELKGKKTVEIVNTSTDRYGGTKTTTAVVKIKDLKKHNYTIK
jgi:hypothetical protein